MLSSLRAQHHPCAYASLGRGIHGAWSLYLSSGVIPKRYVYLLGVLPPSFYLFLPCVPTDLVLGRALEDAVLAAHLRAGQIKVYLSSLEEVEQLVPIVALPQDFL